MRSVRVLALFSYVIAACGNPAPVAPAPGMPGAPLPAMPGAPMPGTPGAPVVAAPAVPAPPAAAAQPPAPAKAPEPTWEERVASSQPLNPTVAPQTLAGRSITAVRCALPGFETLGRSSTDTWGRMEIGPDGKLYVVEREEHVRRFAIGGDATTCTLTLDTTFGTNGDWTAGWDVEELSATTRDVYASGLGHLVRLTGEPGFECTNASGRVSISPDGRRAFGHWSNAPLKSVTFADTSCAVQAVPIPAPLQMVHDVAFLGTSTLLGGNVPQDQGGARIVVAYDSSWRELFRFGSTGSGFSEDRFGWVHGLQACGRNICALDSNYRRVSMWSNRGQFVGAVSLKDLFGVTYPWISDFEMLPDRSGAAYFVVAQERGDTDVSEGLIYRVTGLAS